MLDTLPPELLEYIAYYTHTLAPSDVLSLSLTHTHLLFCLLRTPVSRDLCKSLFGPLACANRRWWRAARLSLDTTLAVASAHRPPFSDTLPLSVLSSTRFAVRNALISTLLAPASSLLPLEVGQHGKTVAAFIKSLPTPDLEAAFDLSPKLFPLATRTSYHPSLLALAAGNNHVSATHALMAVPSVAYKHSAQAAIVAAVGGAYGALVVLASHPGSRVAYILPVLIREAVDRFDLRTLETLAGVETLSFGAACTGEIFGSVCSLHTTRRAVAVADILLGDPDLDPNAGLVHPLTLAIQRGNEQLIDLILRNPRLSIESCADPLYDAITDQTHLHLKRNRVSVVATLLRDTRIPIRPRAIRAAQERRRWKILDLIHQNARPGEELHPLYHHAPPRGPTTSTTTTTTTTSNTNANSNASSDNIVVIDLGP